MTPAGLNGDGVHGMLLHPQLFPDLLRASCAFRLYGLFPYVVLGIVPAPFASAAPDGAVGQAIPRQVMLPWLFLLPLGVKLSPPIRQPGIRMWRMPCRCQLGRRYSSTWLLEQAVAQLFLPRFATPHASDAQLPLVILHVLDFVSIGEGLSFWCFLHRLHRRQACFHAAQARHAH
jgi:hypothetical protein